MQRSDLRLVLPLAALFVAFFVAPLVMLLAMSLSRDADMHALTLANYAKFFTDPFNYSILWSTLVLGVKATLLCLLFGYPLAWIANRASARWQTVLLFLVILPIMTSVVVRTFSWIVILGRQGVLNRIAMGLGLTSEPLRLLFTEPGVVIVLAQVQMPLMVLPILTVMSKLDPNLADASRVLGAGEWRTLWRVTLPLSLPGVIAGALLCFIPIVGEFVIPDLLGSSRNIMIGQAVWTEFFLNKDWPVTCAVAVVLLCLLLAPILVYQRMQSRDLAGSA